MAGSPKESKKSKFMVFKRLQEKMQDFSLSNVMMEKLSEVLEHLQELASNSHQPKEPELLVWAAHHPKLKIVQTPVPEGILPLEMMGVLTDVKVFVKHGPDDAVFDSDAEIRQRIARGNTFLKLHSENNAIDETRMVIYGMKKFTGGIGDDDDRNDSDDAIWKRYFTRPVEDAKKIICTRKANGEAAHLGVIKIQGEFYICAGSKNVHMLLRNKEDISKYRDGRYQVARVICVAVMDLLDAMDDMEKLSLLEFLHLTRFTAVLEILQPSLQHVENLSHLTKPKLQFIAFTNTNDDGFIDNTSLSALPPHLAIEIARMLCLPTIEYTIISTQELESRMKMIRESYGFEGEVFNFLGQDGSLIGLLKKKTIWYIVLRAIREKMKAMAIAYQKDKELHRYKSAVITRLEELQQWLQFDDECLNKYKELGLGMLEWCLIRMKSGIMTHQHLQELFPVQWNLYLQETGKSDEVICNVPQQGT